MHLYYSLLKMTSLTSPLSMQFNPNSRTNECILLEQSLTDRFDKEDLIEPKVVGVHSTDNQQRPRYSIVVLIIRSAPQML